MYCVMCLTSVPDMIASSNSTFTSLDASEGQRTTIRACNNYSVREEREGERVPVRSG